MLWMAVVLGALVIGEVAAHHALLPVPAAAIGLVAVAAYLWLLGEVPEELARIFDTIAPHAPLFFVPAAAGIVVNLDVVSTFWLAFVVAAVLGTAATLVAAGLCAQVLLRNRREGATG